MAETAETGSALGLTVLSTVAATKTESVLEGLRWMPIPPDLLVALTQGYSAAPQASPAA